MNRRNFLRSCAALLAGVAAPVIAKAPQAPQFEVGRWEGFRFIETETIWDLSGEYGCAVPFTDDKSMLWAAAYLKRRADELVPPCGMAELRVQRDPNYGTMHGIALYWNPGPAMQLALPERHLPPKLDSMRGYYLLERFSRA